MGRWSVVPVVGMTGAKMGYALEIYFDKKKDALAFRKWLWDAIEAQDKRIAELEEINERLVSEKAKIAADLYELKHRGG